MNVIQTLAISALPVIFAITLHEAAHGYAARHFGDPTAWQMGRISLNPLRHVDLVGTLLVPALILLVSSGGLLFGWAKPVPVNFGNLRHPKRDMIWVAGAGPLANFVMALGWAFLLGATGPSGSWASDGAYVMADAGVRINLALLALNLLPIPPLDGGRIAVGVLPHRAALLLSRLEPYGFFVILALIAIPGALWTVLGPIYRVFAFLLFALTGV